MVGCSKHYKSCPPKRFSQFIGLIPPAQNVLKEGFTVPTQNMFTFMRDKVTPNYSDSELGKLSYNPVNEVSSHLTSQVYR